MNVDSAAGGAEEAEPPPSSSAQAVAVDAAENAEAGMAEAATRQDSEGDSTQEEAPAGSNGGVGDPVAAERVFVGFGNGAAEADAPSGSQNGCVGAAASASAASESPSFAPLASENSSRPVSDLTNALEKLPGTDGESSEGPSSSADVSFEEKPRNPFAGAAEAAGRAWRDRGGLAGARDGLVRLTNGGWRSPLNPPKASSFIPQQVNPLPSPPPPPPSHTH